MSQRNDAEDHLRMIRQLMERSVVYRGITSISAIVGAVLVALIGAFLWTKGTAITARAFFWIWLVVLSIVDGVNFFFLYRDAKSRGASFPSSGLIHGMLAVMPGFLAGGILSAVVIFMYEAADMCAIIWSICAGLALLSTNAFSPRSVLMMGWGLLLLGLGFFVWRETGGPLPGDSNTAQGAFVMMLTFGLVSAIYGLGGKSRDA